MSRADEIFIDNCRDILENGIWDTDRPVRPKWDDGQSAHTIKKFGIGLSIQKVSLTDYLVNKKYTLDENLSITLSIDINKIPTASLGKVFNTPEKLGQAMAVLFLEKVKAAITTKLTEIRALANDFEAETSVVL